MSQITVDDTLRARLRGLTEPLELRDEAGQTVGHYLPEAVYRLWLAVAADFPQLTPEEIQQRLQDQEGQPLETLWQRLGQS
jgi:hypothetical protein